MSLLRALAAAIVALDEGDAEHARALLASATGATARIPSGAYEGWTILEVHAMPGFGADWLAWALKPVRQWNRPGGDARFRAALAAFIATYEPQLLEDLAEAK